MATEVIEQLLNKGYYYLYLRSRSEQEMRNYLEKKAAKLHATQEDIDVVIKELKLQRYLDDKKFIESYVRYRSSFKPKGEYALRQELKQKGISDELINNYFENQNLDETNLAQAALSKVWHRYKGLEPIKRKKRVIQFLGRRGFSFDAINDALKKAEENT